MRNLKRALSLALASVMVLGLMVVGSGASYADVTSEANQEAIEVLQAVGIMTGDQNGNFNPDANVTRNEMAVIMSNLMDYRVANYKGTSPFSDVPDWAEPYVAACYTNGITSGIGGNLYGGEQQVTTAQAGLMMMKALGYFQNASDFDNDWQLATVSQGNKITLFKGVDSAIIDPMTRNDVAQLVLNTLSAGMVELDDSSKVSVDTNGVKVDIGGSKYNYVTSGERYAKAIDDKLYVGNQATDVSTSGAIVELGERLYMGDLRRENWEKDQYTDDFGAPATRWSYKNVTIGEYADKADYVFTGAVKSNKMYETLGKTVVDRYNPYYTIDGISGGSYDNNGNFVPASGQTDKDLGVRFDNKTKDPADPTKHLSQSMFSLKKMANRSGNNISVEGNTREDLPGTGRGTTTYVYLDDTRGEEAVHFVIICDWAAEVIRSENGEVMLDDIHDDDLTFDTDAYEEGDVVIYHKARTGGAWEIKEIVGLAERVEGENAIVRDQDRVSIDGKTYQYTKRYNDSNGDKLGTDYVNNNVSFFVDTQGHIILLEDVDLTNDYAYVYSVGIENSKYNDKDVEFGAKLILTDGTTKRVVIDTDDTDPLIKNIPGSGDIFRNDALEAVQTKFEHEIVAYSEDDGAYSLSVRTTNGVFETKFGAKDKDIIKNSTAQVKIVDGGTSVYADKNTAFLVHEKGDKDDDFSAYTGYNNVPSLKSNNQDDDTVVLAYVSPTTGVAKAVVVLNADVSGTSKNVIFLKGDNGPKLEEDRAGNRYYNYSAVVDGEVKNLKIKADSDTARDIYGVIKKGDVGVFFGMSENSSGIITNLTTKIPSDVEINGITTAATNGKYNAYTGTKRVSSGGNVTFNTAVSARSFPMGDDALIIYFNKDNSNAFEIDSRVRTDDNDKAWVVVDDGVVVAVCVKEVPNT